MMEDAPNGDQYGASSIRPFRIPHNIEIIDLTSDNESTTLPVWRMNGLDRERLNRRGPPPPKRRRVQEETASPPVGSTSTPPTAEALEGRIWQYVVPVLRILTRKLPTNPANINKVTTDIIERCWRDQQFRTITANTKHFPEWSREHISYTEKLVNQAFYTLTRSPELQARQELQVRQSQAQAQSQLGATSAAVPSPAPPQPTQWPPNRPSGAPSRGSLPTEKRAPSQRPASVATSLPADQPRPSIETPAGQAREISRVARATRTPQSGSKSRLALPHYPVSPVSYRSHARVSAWKYRKSPKRSKASVGHEKKVWLKKRPYLSASMRKTIARGSSKLVRLTQAERQRQQQNPRIYHVDFTAEEVECVRRVIRQLEDKKPQSGKNALKETRHYVRAELRKGASSQLPNLVESLCKDNGLAQRDEASFHNFLGDVARYKTNPSPAALRLDIDELDRQNEAVRAKHVSSLLLAREMEGQRGFGSMRRQINFTNEFRNAIEDGLELRAEWTNCAGDIATISWISNDHFLCGTTAHSDSHNQQYNKPGNLLLCALSEGKLQAYPDHRIPRPIIDKGENAGEAMRESQDPWLYSSVVSSDYDEKSGRAFTSSFDKTVKVWEVDRTEGKMEALATWEHQGNVNFVAACKDGSGMVATGADVPHEAVRVYMVDQADTSASPYFSLSGTRSWDEDNLNTDIPQKWAYFPATMQWGAAKDVQHLLLVGYSPRSLTGDDNDVPLDKASSGEICVFNCRTRQRLKVLTASTQNVFEVAWHPTQPGFVVATSPAGNYIEEGIRTQIRLFRPSDNLNGLESFSEVQCLDCSASDINELTITPCSLDKNYVTAAATDGKVYVWDTARGDLPIHIISHGTPLEGDATMEHYDRERDDTGVKFTAWGSSPDRFYTGGSDGVVKVWNIRNQKQPLNRVLLEVPAPVSSGAFSPDKTKLAIGDATGRVYLLSTNEADEPAAGFVNLPQATRLALPVGAKSIRRPKTFTPHATPPPPPPPANSVVEPESGIERGRRHIKSGHLQINKNPCVGAVQGPTYANLGLYREDMHSDNDRDRPLRAEFDRQQQENLVMFKGFPKRPKTLRVPPKPLPESEEQHRRNQALDWSLRDLDEVTQLELKMAGVNIDQPDEEDYGFEYESE